MKYFTLEECIYSATAEAMGIDNTPSPKHEANIIETVDNLLDPLREAWGNYCLQAGLGKQGIHITSGYRSPALNKAVGGSSTSAHCYGYAFDLIPTNNHIIVFKHFCRNFLENYKGSSFDQLISEKEDEYGVPNWMHVGYKHPNGQQRRQFLSMINGGYCPMTD